MAKIKKTIFIRDKFEIFISVINRAFCRSKYDEPLTLSKVSRMIDDTEIVFNEFDKTISVQENVEKYYNS